MTCCGFGFYLALVGFVSWHLPSSIYHLLSVDGHVNLHHYHWDLICDRSFFVSPFLELAPEFSNANIFSWPPRLEPHHCIDFWGGPLKLPPFAHITLLFFGFSHSRLGWGFANLDLSPHAVSFSSQGKLGAKSGCGEHWTKSSTFEKSSWRCTIYLGLGARTIHEMFIDCRFAARSVETKTIVTVIQHMSRSAIVVLLCSHDTVSLDCMREGYSTCVDTSWSWDLVFFGSYFYFQSFYFLVVGFGNYHLRCSPNATLLCKVETTGTHCQRHSRSHKKKRRTSVQGDDSDDDDDED